MSLKNILSESQSQDQRRSRLYEKSRTDKSIETEIDEFQFGGREGKGEGW